MNADMQAQAAQRVAIVLEPLTHPELGPLAVDDSLFAIGRTEQPFAGYPPEVVADLSRRHARIFIENGGAWLADLDSKNGTTVNGVPVRQSIVRLRDGDEVDFARVLAYRVRLQAAAPASSRARAPGQPDPDAGARRAGAGDDRRHQLPFPDQQGRRHLRALQGQGAAPGRLPVAPPCAYLPQGRRALGRRPGQHQRHLHRRGRLDEHAHALEDGDVLAFGGHHFVYRVGLAWEQAKLPDPTVTRVAYPSPPARQPRRGEDGDDADHTTFVASAGSFLDIFCVDRAAAQEDEVNPPRRRPPARAGAGQAPAWQGGHAGGRPARRAGRRRRRRPGDIAALDDDAERTGVGRRAGRLPGRRAAARAAGSCSTAANCRRRQHPGRRAAGARSGQRRAAGAGHRGAAQVRAAAVDGAAEGAPLRACRAGGGAHAQLEPP
jgi:pSer/pThr/pTyr-binding forkhead associated (FHA) protein